MQDLLADLNELCPEKTLQEQSQAFLEIRYRYPEYFEIMQDQPDDPTKHWVKVKGTKFLYIQPLSDLIASLKDN